MRQTISKFTKKARSVESLWRYGFNFLPSINYKIASPQRGDKNAAEVLGKLNRSGVAVTSVAELPATETCFAELESAAAKLLEKRGAEIERLRIKADDRHSVGDKTFNVELLGSQIDFEPTSIFARFALQPTVLNIVNAYFQMYAKLRYYNVWQTFAAESEARESQLWHFDREDNYILKMFVYLKDVDEGAGPFTYAPETHRKGRLWGIEPESFVEGNVRRSSDQQMAKIVPEKNWHKATGRKGTIVFADTRGYHKGGEARTRDRLMYTCMFTSAASQSQKLLNFPDKPLPENFTREQILAAKPF